MDNNNQEEEPAMAMVKKSSLNGYRLMNGPSGWFEIRLFYVRVAPCAVDAVPDHLTLRHLRREIGVSMEINGARIPASEATALILRRDRLDKGSSEVTYVSTDSVKVSGSVEFEVYEKEDMILCGSLERMEAAWSNGTASITSGLSPFFQPKLGVSAPSFEVYIAGCCSGKPVILTKTIQISPRRKLARQNMLDAIPEDEEIGKEQKNGNGFVRQRKIQLTETEADDYDSDGKYGSSYYSEDMYAGEDGQLSWFNAGVRVGVGIGLGMCIGVGVGVGLLMRSYQATTRSFRRRFL
ncbi:hypothetical protein NMG60_11022809 [Bertholletia excelsa]